MTCLGERNELVLELGVGGRAGEPRTTLQRIARSPQQQRGAARLKHRSSHPHQPQSGSGQHKQKQQNQPADHGRRLVEIRRRIRMAPVPSRTSGAIHSGHAAGSLVGR